MKIKKVLAAVNDDITAIQVNNSINQPDQWELEFIQLKPEIVDEILAWQPDLVIFDISFVSGASEIDYPQIFSNNNIPFIILSSSSEDTILSESDPSKRSFNLPDLKNALLNALNTDSLLI
jgi:hypothetical protein